MTRHDSNRPIVVATDGSPAARNAVAWAARTAASREDPLLVLHVRRPDARPSHVVDLLRTALRQARRAAPDVRLLARVELDDVDTALVAASAEASLLVLGVDPHEVPGADEARASIEDRIVRHARCPVALVTAPGSSALYVGAAASGGSR